MTGRAFGTMMIAAVLAGCGEQGNELREATERRRATEARDDSAVADSAPRAPARLPAFVLADSTPAAQPADSAAATPAPGADSAAAPSPAPAPAPQADWTSGRTQVRRRPGGVATLREVRTAPNAGFDRFVVALGADAIPGYRIEYVDRPVHQCGSGEATKIAGDGWLSITLHAARAHDDQGRATIGQRERALSLPVLREYEFTCDFEAEVQIVLGVASPNRYRVLELANPSRLVIDVQH
ncbi:AMIN-like domain-containing (lipo)protein [Longimicrobium sp.]|uniref:AMIN-like domain-containing (lipo)protein n=1 Tax=Longimicrobium sp. TaxID=2029185 RepID=UPI002EDAA23D